MIEPRQAIRTGSNLVDMGRAAAHDRLVDGRLRRPARFVGWEATVKACGVAVARLPGNSWTPPPVDRCVVNVGTALGLPSPPTSQVGGGQARRRLMASGGTEPP